MDIIELGCSFGLWVILARILNQPPLARQRRREELLAGFDRRRANRALAQLGTPTAEATP